MQVVIAQQKRHLLRMGLLESNDVPETLEGITPINPVILVRVQIIPQEHNMRVSIHALHCPTPEFSAVEVGDDEVDRVHTLRFYGSINIYRTLGDCQVGYLLQFPRRAHLPSTIESGFCGRGSQNANFAGEPIKH